MESFDMLEAVNSDKKLQPPPPPADRLGADDDITQPVSAEAAEAAIEAKRIGERIKHLRTRKHMGLVELGRHTGLSASFLSQLETGRVVPTLRNLSRIATVFSRHLSYFFEPDKPETFRILRAADRQRQPQSGSDEPGYYFESLGQVPDPDGEGGNAGVTPYVAEFLPAGPGRVPRSHRHRGHEFLYVMAGSLEITSEEQHETLHEGDAVYFDADAPHSYQCSGDAPCTALILSMPDKSAPPATTNGAATNGNSREGIRKRL